MIWGIWLDGPPISDGLGMGMGFGLYSAAMGILILFAIGMLIYALVRRRPFLATFVRSANVVLPVVAAVTLVG